MPAAAEGTKGTRATAAAAPCTTRPCECDCAGQQQEQQQEQQQQQQEQQPLLPPPAAAPQQCASPALSHGEQLLSVVIPAYNEAGSIGEVVAAALRAGGGSAEGGVEVVVCDGGSSDATRAAAEAAGARVVGGASGRAACLNAGAAAAQGELLLFLHADTTLPPGYGPALRAALASPSVSLAAFSLALAPPLPLLWLVEWGANVRSRRRQLPYGDQGLGLRRAMFERLGRFAPMPFLEDLELVRRARALGVVRTLPLAATSSSRKWRAAGVLRNTLNNQLVLAGHALGVPIARLAVWYRGLTAV